MNKRMYSECSSSSNRINSLPSTYLGDCPDYPVGVLGREFIFIKKKLDKEVNLWYNATSF